MMNGNWLSNEEKPLKLPQTELVCYRETATGLLSAHFIHFLFAFNVNLTLKAHLNVTITTREH